MKVAAIGECMVELSPRDGGLFAIGFGGDTLNTAVYLARLGVAVDYVTALGDDPFSERMVAAWREEGVGTALVVRCPGRLPGLCVTGTDPDGERRFHCWRDRAPARELFALPEAGRVMEALAEYDWIYLSGVSLSLYGARGRPVLLGALDQARRHGCRIVFEVGYRSAGWPDPATARRAVAAILPCVDIVFTGVEDESALRGDAEMASAARRYRGLGVGEVVVKGGQAGAVAATAGGEAFVPAQAVARIVDPTAAGDAFNAAYLAARFAGASPEAAAQAGHRLAAMVIGHRGAIIPAAAMAGRPDAVAETGTART